MKKVVLGLLLLVSGFQCQASSPIDPEAIKAAVELGQCCIAGCEATRYMIRSLNLATTTNADQLQTEQTLSCCNVYTICAVACCVHAPTTYPELIGAGVSCSIIGCCRDYAQYHNTLAKGEYKDRKIN